MYSYRIEQAIRAASILHKDQVRVGEVPIPYISHLMSVTLILHDYTDNEDVIVAALLHDTVEDTDYTFDELQEDFGVETREIVESLSEPASTSDKPVSWIEKKKQYAKKLKKASEEALIIAAADKIHNLRMMVEQNHDDHARFLAIFGDKVVERLAGYEAISNALNSRLKSDILHEFNNVFTEYKNFLADVKQTQENSQL